MGVGFFGLITGERVCQCETKYCIVAKTSSHWIPMGWARKATDDWTHFVELCLRAGLGQPSTVIFVLLVFQSYYWCSPGAWCFLRNIRRWSGPAAALRQFVQAKERVDCAAKVELIELYKLFTVFSYNNSLRQLMSASTIPQLTEAYFFHNWAKQIHILMVKSCSNTSSSTE